jgi:hypothetical protein
MPDEVSNDDVMGSMMFERTKQEYPYLADKDISFKYSPNEGRGFLEFYGEDEPGSPEYPRPKEFPMGKIGLEVFNPKTRPLDILGDYVSHYGVEKDPYLTERYQQFSESFTPEQQQRLQEQYKYYHEHPEYKESRPFEYWKKASGMPGYFRGYTFDQWENSKDAYTPQQLRVLDEVKKYLGVK